MAELTSSVGASPVEIQRDLTDEAAIALGFSSKGPGRRLLAPLVRVGTRRVAEWLSEADQLALEKGTREAADYLLSRIVSGVRVFGVERVPAEGPLVFAGNHPGSVDGLVTLSQSSRNDTRVYATSIPIFRRLRCAEKIGMLVA